MTSIDYVPKRKKRVVVIKRWFDMMSARYRVTAHRGANRLGLRNFAREATALQQEQEWKVLYGLTPVVDWTNAVDEQGHKCARHAVLTVTGVVACFDGNGVLFGTQPVDQRPDHVCFISAGLIRLEKREQQRIEREKNHLVKLANMKFGDA